MSEVLQFGQRVSGVEYLDRPGAYVVLVNDRGDVAIIDVDGHFHLPGGGIEAGESETEAARRELAEEIGSEVTLGEPIGRANQYVQSLLTRQYFNKMCTYFLGRVANGGGAAWAAEHEVIWVAPDEARMKLDHESHSWAVGQAQRTMGI